MKERKLFPYSIYAKIRAFRLKILDKHPEIYYIDRFRLIRVANLMEKKPCGNCGKLLLTIHLTRDGLCLECEGERK